MRIRSLIPVAVALFVLVAAAPTASAQCGNPTCSFQTFNLAPNSPVLTVLNCPNIGNPLFHVHVLPVPPGSNVLAFWATATTGGIGIPINLGGPTPYNILIDPSTILLTTSSIADGSGHAPHYVSIPNDASLLGAFLAIQCFYFNAATSSGVLLNRISFTVCS